MSRACAEAARQAPREASGQAVTFSMSSRPDEVSPLSMFESRDGAIRGKVHLDPSEFEAAEGFVARFLRDVDALNRGDMAQWPERPEHLGVVPRWNGRFLSVHLVRAESGEGLLRFSVRIEGVAQGVRLRADDAQRLMVEMATMRSRLLAASVPVRPPALATRRRAHEGSVTEVQLLEVPRGVDATLRFTRSAWGGGTDTLCIREFVGSEAQAQGLNLNQSELESILDYLADYRRMVVRFQRGRRVASTIEVAVIGRSRGRLLRVSILKTLGERLVFSLRVIDGDRTYGATFNSYEATRLRRAIHMFQDPQHAAEFSVGRSAEARNASHRSVHHHE